MQADEKFYVTGEGLNDEDYVNLTMLNYDEIAYDKLSDGVLSRLARSSELYIATASLEELARRQSPQAAQVGAEILRSRVADGHLKALAFDVVFTRDPAAAVELTQPLIQEDDPILASKAAQVLTDHPALSSDPAVRALASSLLESFQRLNESDPRLIEESLVAAIARFKK